MEACVESAQPERCEHHNTDGSSEGCAYDRRDSLVYGGADRPGWAWALRRIRRRRRRRHGARRWPFVGRRWRGARRWRREGARRRRRPGWLRRRARWPRWRRRREGAGRKARRPPRRRWRAWWLRWGQRRQRARRKARWLPRWRWCSALRLCYVTSYDGGKQEPARTTHRDYVEEPVLRRLATFEAASGTGWPTVATTSNSFQCPNERHQTCTRNCERRDSARLAGQYWSRRDPPQL